MNVIYYLVDKTKKTVLRSGAIPHTYGTMAGLDALPYDQVSNLGSWAGQYEGFGFLTYDDAVKVGIPTATVDKARDSAYELKWAEIKPLREDLIQNQQWRVDRYASETLLGTTHKEDITPVLVYMQTIRDLPNTQTDPFNIVWPAVPA